MEYMEYLSKCCKVSAKITEEGYVCEKCGEECSIIDPSDVEPLTE
jgi:hypothetical protein